ncbi:DoxX family protein [Amycolatopsis acidicola]|uniref:DoxX family protein n=1 Tax=Amycolatopsis acidicola TaxID=2596893 RepID=A0A5N0UTV5_9PSEU|nr:DoxX family protein [Amycolatopsis acidicola]KAA9154670.1 DoxX family protein [Amycolatopsis acidicola]
MNLALWIIAGLLAATFLASGVLKLTQSQEKLAAAAPFGGAGLMRLVGVLEILATAGLILPAALGIAEVLVPVAAVGAAVLMAGAVTFHLRRREAQGVVVTLVLLALAVVVAWGRFGPQSFTS